MIAARGGHNETVQTLIAAGADLNIRSVKVLFCDICLLLHVYTIIIDYKVWVDCLDDSC